MAAAPVFSASFLSSRGCRSTAACSWSFLLSPACALSLHPDCVQPQLQNCPLLLSCFSIEIEFGSARLGFYWKEVLMLPLACLAVVIFVCKPSTKGLYGIVAVPVSWLVPSKAHRWANFPSSHQPDAGDSTRSRSREGPETQRHRSDRPSRWAWTSWQEWGMQLGSCWEAES